MTARHRKRLSLGLLTLGALSILVANYRGMFLWWILTTNPPRRYHYYFLAPDAEASKFSVVFTGIGVFLVGCGLVAVLADWGRLLLTQTRRDEKG